MGENHECICKELPHSLGLCTRICHVSGDRPLGAGAGVSVGGEGGISAGGGLGLGGSSGTSAGAGASIGGSSGVSAGAGVSTDGTADVDAGATASVGGPAGAAANIGVGTTDPTGVGIGIGLGTATSGAAIGPTSTGLAGVIANMTEAETAKFRKRCEGILNDSAGFDRDLIALCKMLQTASR